MTQRYLEDFAVGQTFGSGRVTVETDHIKTFAADGNQQVSDPQLSRRRRGRLDAEHLDGACIREPEGARQLAGEAHSRYKGHPPPGNGPSALRGN
jgi:hypothetical protein